MKAVGCVLQAISVVLLSGVHQSQSVAQQTRLMDRSSPKPTINEQRNARVIDDCGTGHRWLYLRDSSRPTGPAKLVMIVRDASDDSYSRSCREFNHALVKAERPSIPVIRAGDLIELSEITPGLAVHLQAIALASASVGDPLKVRLKIGRRVLRAVATGSRTAKAEVEEGHH